MNDRLKSVAKAGLARRPHEVELRILPDGRVLAHNLSLEMAALLGSLAPRDATMQQRASSHSAPAPPAKSLCRKS